MLASLPQGLVPLLGGTRLSGTFRLTGALRFDTRELGELKVTWRVDNRCRITHVPPHVAPERFKQPFTYYVTDASGRLISIVAGPGTPTWVPLFDISRYMQAAVLVCEDGRFWRHEGFDHEAIKNSLRDNLKAEGFVRGASTISMQLAKNLYLRRDKTLSRKLQEVVLTMLLEQELTKEQILELYLNVIEYAPGVYGIGPAAAHYFRSQARDLTLGQSLYLASILPNPAHTHFGRDSKLSKGWSSYLRRLMKIARDRKLVSDEELEEGLREEIVLGQPGHLAQEDGFGPEVDPLEQETTDLPPGL
jgi:membrane peptidoglycan carboxypeptidase